MFIVQINRLVAPKWAVDENSPRQYEAAQVNNRNLAKTVSSSSEMISLVLSGRKGEACIW